MNSLGVFFDLNLKKSNDLMEVFDDALSKTNNLMETMENFNTHKRIENINNNNESNKNNVNNNNNLRNNNRLRTYNHKKTNKAQLKPIKNNNNNQYYFKKREPYNYQKEYENELINQIEKLFNPSYNGKQEEVGMLSFLSPLINSNIDEKNKKFYKNKKEIIKSKNNNLNNIINKDNEKEKEYDQTSNESEDVLSRSLNRKYSNNNTKLRISKKNNLLRKGFETHYNRKIFGNSMGRKLTNGFRKNKYDIPEINELKKNRYFSRTKNNFRNAIVARDISANSRKKESNVDQLIKKLKKHYS